MKHWSIFKTKVNSYDDDEHWFIEDAWVITDGIAQYVFPVTKYPTQQEAWDAWKDKIM